MRTDKLWVGIVLCTVAAVATPVVRAGAQTQPGFAPALALLQSASEDDGVFTGDHTIAAGETVPKVVVLGGTLTVLGRVTGDAVVMGGDLVLESGGLVSGDAVVTGGEIVDHGGRVRGEMRVVDMTADELAAALATAGASAPSATAAPGARNADVNPSLETVREVRELRRHGDHGGWSALSHGFLDLVSVLVLAVVLAGIGAALIFYGRPYLETVSDTIRNSTTRSAAVGLAASFLVVPAFVVLMVALVVSIVGIPLLLVAIPLYPLALAAAGVFGFLATAHAIGEHTANQRRGPFDLHYRNSYAYLFTGLTMLLASLAVASLLEMTGFLGFLGVLLKIVTVIGLWVAATIGFGAVILSRAGTRRTFVLHPREPGFDSDLFDETTVE